MDIYKEKGYESREDYFLHLSDKYNISIDIIKELADEYGQDEDFNGLVFTLESITPYYDHMDDDFYDRCLG